jgi:hypothetical protein
MNTFFVGNHPVGHYTSSFSSPKPSKYAALIHNPTISASPDTGLRSTQTDASPQPPTTPQSTPVDGEKTFFMKARIMAGQAQLPSSDSPGLSSSQSNSSETKSIIPAGLPKSMKKDISNIDLGLEEVVDFRWLSKDEVEEIVEEEYFRGVRNMLVAQ